MPLEPGQTAEVHQVVTRELTADVLGNPGVTVFATPFVLTLLENAAHAVMAPHVPPGGATVGTRVDMRHLAATPPGMTVRAKAVLLETDGRRCVFEVEAWDEVDKIAGGRHERFMVPDLARFLERARSRHAGGASRDA
ncbi:MAG TPA: hotdog domain-containing protein [Methylomirabilota bacterium]|nr:hotdog domain-containing protein [Methylomirabilota bacterium]